MQCSNTASATTLQAKTQAQRDEKRQQKEEALAAARGLEKLRRQNPPRFEGDHDPDKDDPERFVSGFRYKITEVTAPHEIRQYEALVDKCKKTENLKRSRPSRDFAGGLRGTKADNMGLIADHKEVIEINLEEISRLSTEIQFGLKGGGKDLGDTEEISYFFFTEFPKTYGAKNMAKIFKEYGIVIKVFIPARRDNRGKWYGFVRYIKVNDERLMVAKLDNIQIEGRKIFANVPRFKRGGRQRISSIEIWKGSFREEE
ncbi:hypothetical protein KIW84_057384 [Lathyrus oleraceus]|uniref:RRM domain-containing protein n=1 Tax=Pisum sativum TaxID=3888 RepID=A0A9D4X5T3_PEA|nr:hypothetical protein KIW84_057384 [Pisum sativum]